jgi:predicted ATPase
MHYPRLAADPVAEDGIEEPEDSVARKAQGMTQYSAVKLFWQAAARVHAGFEPSPEELTDIAHICGLVEGMPLGILLAAAWVDVLRPAEIRAEIENSLDFLQTQWHDLPDRHRSLRGVFDHSWSLLGQQERNTVQMLSVFRGGFTRQAAEAVAGVSLRRLQDLVRKSFLQHQPAPSTLPSMGGRYDIHELLRQYAAEKLAESPSTWESAHEHHSAHYAGALQRWATELKGPERQAVLSEMDADIDNLRVAWRWAADHGHVERMDQALEGFQLFFWLRGRYLEGEAAMGEATRGLDPVTDALDELRVRARASIWQSQFCYVLGNREQANELQKQVLALLDRPEMIGHETRLERALLLLATARTQWWSDQQRASRLLKQAIPLLRELDDTWRVAEALAMLGRGAVFSGAVDKGVRWLQESMALYRNLGDDSGCATSMAYLSNAALTAGRTDEAEDLARQAAQLSLQRGSRAEYVHKLGVLGYCLVMVGKYAEAHEVLEECIKIRQGEEARYHNAHTRSSLSGASLHLGRYAEASAHAEAALADARAAGVVHAVGHALTVLGCVALVQGRYVEAHSSVQEAIEVLREWGKLYVIQPLSVLSVAARALGSQRKASQHLVEALHLSVELGRMPAIPWNLAVAALLLADEDKAERAVELHALAERYPRVANSRWLSDVAGQHIARVAASLPPGVAAAAREHGQALELGEAAKELLAELLET